VPKSKKPVRRQAPEWDIYRLRGSPATFVGRVAAKDKAAAIAAAIELYTVPPRHQNACSQFAVPHDQR
jgi:hypothetical protein